MIALARAGCGAEDLARPFEPCATTIHGWIKQADRDVGRRVDGLTSEERDELPLECELFDRRKFRTKAEGRMAVFRFIEGWYNPGRRKECP
jgi:hypothetical protein